MWGSAVRVTAIIGLAAAWPPGCAAPPSADADSCRPQQARYLDVGRGFTPALGIAPGRWADTGPAADDLAGSLAKDNAELDRLQIAFDALLYCRWIEIRTIRADHAAGGLPKPVAQGRLNQAQGRLKQDLDNASRLRARIAERARATDAAVERAQPGLRAALARARAARGAAVPAVASATIALRLRPDPVTPEVGRVAAGGSVTVRPAPDGFAYIESGPEMRGYAPAAAFSVAPRGSLLAPLPVAERGGDVLRTLAATNLAKRENFFESVELAERSLGTGFELAL